ncbi:MAG: hypothetical protein GY719_37340 [bacterium]|nr:hypothetical protein [bacterium]
MTDVSSQILALLLDVSFRSLLLAAAVALALKAWRVTDPTLLHLAWRGVLCGMLVMPALCLWAPAMPVGTPASFTALQQSLDETLEPLPARLSTLAPSTSPAAAVFEGPGDGSARALWPAPPAAGEGTLERASTGWTWQGVLIVLYGLGAAWMGSRLLVAWWLTRRLRADAQPLADDRWLRVARQTMARQTVGRRHRRLSLVLHAGIRVPLATGWLRPTVLLPLAWQRWDEAKRRSILTHELLHVCRGDYAVQLLAALNRVLFWFHPLAWALPRRLASLAERCCDAGVVRTHGNGRQYARYLIEVASAVAADPAGRQGRVAWIGNAMTDGEGLSRRIRGVLAAGHRQGLRNSGRLARVLAPVAVAALVVLAAAGAAVVHLEAAEPSAPVVALEPAPATFVLEPAPAVLELEAASEMLPAPILARVEVATTVFGNTVLGAPTDVAAAIAESPVAPERPAASTSPARVAPPVPAVPRNFILFFDDESRQATRPSPRGLYIGSAVEAARHWIETELRPSDRVAVLSYKGHLRFHQDLTADRNALARALGQVTRRKASPVGAATEDPGLLSALPAGRELKKHTRQVVPSLHLLAEASATIDGDKTLVLFTAGLSKMNTYGGAANSGLAVNRSFFPRQIADLVDTMRASDVTVYTIFLSPPVFRGQGGGADLLAARTDGGYFFRHHVHGVGPILNGIADLVETGRAPTDPSVLQVSAVRK